MNALLDRVSSTRGSLACVVVVAAAVLILSTGRSGFWEPHEVDVLTELDRDREAKANPKNATANEPRDQRARRAGVVPSETHRSCSTEGPVVSLGRRLVGASHRALGGEWGARLPLVLAALALCLMVWLLASLAASPRAGFFAALVLLTFPALLFGAKQITGDTVAWAAATLSIVGGAIGLGVRSRSRERWLGGLCCLAGAVLGTLASGLLIGVVAPFAAIAIASFASTRGEPGDRARRWHWVTGWCFAGAAVTAAAVFVVAVFDWVPAKTGDLHLAGKTLVACRGVSWAAMASWFGAGATSVGFNAQVEDIAFGAFPWAALAPFAVLALLSNISPRRKTIGTLLFGWAALSWIFGGISERGSTPMHFTGYAAVAVAVGIWVDDFIAGRRDHLGAELVGLFVGLGAIVLAKDLAAFPEKLVSVALADGEYAVPKGLWLPRITAAFGIAFAIALAAALVAREISGRLGAFLRSGVLVATGLSLAFGLYLAHIAIPGLSGALSSAGSFDVLGEIRNDEPLGVLGRLGAGPTYYAGDDYIELKNKKELYDLLAREERVFALMPATDLCTLHAAAPGNDFAYYVIDDENTKHMLLSNKLGQGEQDRNKLARTIVRRRPDDVGTELSVDFDGEIELIGVDMPKSVDRGDRFEMTLYYEVKKRVRRNWKIFVHFDGSGQRFQGDHDPAETFCGTARWRAGDFIVDTIEVTAGGLTYPKGNYQVWTGFFSGSAGNWTNMEVKTPGADAANRFPIGTLRVK